jgi:hypothetical protein
VASYLLGIDEVGQLFRSARRRLIMAQSPYPLASFVTAAWLAATWPAGAGIVLGMGLAWSWSLVGSLRHIRARYRAYLANPSAVVTFEITSEAVRWQSPVGEGSYRWHAISLEEYGDAFVVRDNDRDLALLPRRVLSPEDRALLQAHLKGRRTTR